MKKIYKAPTTVVVNMEIQNHLCETSQIGTGDYTGGGIESRGGFWDDED